MQYGTYSLWRRPGRWWIHLIRWAYPRGLHFVLHRWGTRLARQARPTRISRLSFPVQVSDAVALLSSDREARLLGGGTDILPAHEQGLVQVAHLVDIKDLAEIGEMSEAPDGGLVIGGGVTLADISRRADPDRDLALLQTIETIASQQVREMAVLAGNLCQANRCWFYRNGFACYKRGGVTCPCYAVTGDNRFYHAVLGAHRCQAVTPSDMATTLAALDAVAHVVGPGGNREVPIARLFVGPGETVLARDEMITAVQIPGSARARTSRFEKLRLWEGGFAVVSACASIELGMDGVIVDARVVLGAVAPIPYRAVRTEEALRGKRLTDATISDAAAAWRIEADPLPGNEWKVEAARELVSRCLRSVAERPVAAS